MKKKQKVNKEITEEFIEMLELTALQKRKKHEKELKSLKNKMSGKALIWFNSLSKTKQFDFLFEWKSEKYWNKKEKVEINYIYKTDWANYPKKKKITIKRYPSSLKHFIKQKMKSYKYRISKEKLRDTTINSILN